VDDEAWEPEPARGGGTRGSEPPEGEVTIALEGEGIEVLVPPRS
jgi:hypothetical protein